MISIPTLSALHNHSHNTNCTTDNRFFFHQKEKWLVTKPIGIINYGREMKTNGVFFSLEL